MSCDYHFNFKAVTLQSECPLPKSTKPSAAFKGTSAGQGRRLGCTQDIYAFHLCLRNQIPCQGLTTAPPPRDLSLTPISFHCLQGRAHFLSGTPCNSLHFWFVKQQQLHKLSRKFSQLSGVGAVKKPSHSSCYSQWDALRS